jgi:RimJ/RimL family protein N-acetyltransferase
MIPNAPPAVVQGEVTLLPYAKENDEKTVGWLNDAFLQRSFGLDRRVTLEGHRAWRAAQNDLLLWAITHQGRHVGNCSLRWHARHASAYFQIYLGEAAVRGRGIGKAATTAALDYAFAALKAHRVWLHVFPHNARALAIYRGLGFVDEGLEREAILLEGRYLSQLRLSLLDVEWQKRGATW